MVDVRKPATLRGFNVSIADVGDQMHLCHPLLSFEGDSTLYIAHRLDWRKDPEVLAIADPDDALLLGTLLPETRGWPIASGQGVIAVGVGFLQAAATAEVQFPGTEASVAQIEGSECWMGVATLANYNDLRTRLINEARTAFDEELGDAARRGRHLSERGNAALLLLRRCGPLRHEDLAIRQLAGARQNRELDLYRRLLIRFEIELDAQQDDLHRQVEKHIELAAAPLQHKVMDRTVMGIVPKLGQKKVSMLAAKAGSAEIQTRMFDQSASRTGRRIYTDYTFRSIHSRRGDKFSKFQKNNNFREHIQPIIQELPKRLEPKGALPIRFFSKATETSSRKPTIGFLSFRIATLPFAKKGVVDTKEYQEAL